MGMPDYGNSGERKGTNGMKLLAESLMIFGALVLGFLAIWSWIFLAISIIGIS